MRLLLVLFFLSFSAAAQESLDSLHRLLNNHSDDSGKVDILNRISFLNLAHSLDSMELYAHKAIALGEELQYLRGVAEGYKNLGTAYYAQGSYSLGIEQLFESLKISERIHDKRGMAKALHNIGGTYFYQEDYNRALEFTKRSIELFKAIGDVEGVATAQLSVCECYLKLQKPDEAISYCEEARKVFERRKNKERQGHAMLYLGGVYLLKNQPEAALKAYWRASRLVMEGNYIAVGVYLNQDLGKFYAESKQYDSAFFYLYKSLSQLKKYDSKDALMRVHDALGELHERVKRYDSALFYNKLFGDASHKDFNLRRNDQVASLEAHYNLELTNQQLLLNQEVLKSQRTLLISIGVILLIVIISSFIIFRLYLRYRAANKQLIELNSSINEKNEEILAQSDELKSVNDAMQQINSNLESIVEERTHEVKMRNDKLVEYAYFNAHKVRGPLARILGLINLLEMDKEESDLNVFLEKMRTSALELDEVVREINKKLDTD